MGLFDIFRKRVKEVAEDTDEDELSAQEESEEAEAALSEREQLEQEAADTETTQADDWEDIESIEPEAPSIEPESTDEWDDWEDDPVSEPLPPSAITTRRPASCPACSSRLAQRVVSTSSSNPRRPIDSVGSAQITATSQGGSSAGSCSCWGSSSCPGGMRAWWTARFTTLLAVAWIHCRARKRNNIRQGPPLIVNNSPKSRG